MVDPGAIFSLLTNIIELSKKSDEHNDELNELHQNSQILFSLIKDLETTNVIPDCVKEDVVKDLAEAKKLLESPEITNFTQKLICGVMAFLPGNKTSQLKEKNEKIYRHIHRVKALLDVKITKNALSSSVNLLSKSNSHPDSSKNSTTENQNDDPLPNSHILKRTKTETLSQYQIFEPTLNENLLAAATLNQNQYDDETAYEISWDGDKSIFEQYLVSNKDFNITETLRFREVKDQLMKDKDNNMKEIYSIGRGKFMNLIKDKADNVRSFLNLISGNHLKLLVQKIQVTISTDTKQDESSDKMLEKGTLFFTCNDGNENNGEENKKDEEINIHYDFELYVQDTSTNGSYILKKKNVGKYNAWERLPSKQNQLIEDGDKIGIVMDTKTHQILLLGFLFRKIQY